MQNGTNFAVICNPKTPVELLKLHGHFREESILTLRHSPLFFTARAVTSHSILLLRHHFSAAIWTEPRSVTAMRCSVPGLEALYFKSGHTCRSIISSQHKHQARLLSLVVSLPKPPLHFHLEIGTLGKSLSCLSFLAGYCGCYCYTHFFCHIIVKQETPLSFKVLHGSHYWHPSHGFSSYRSTFCASCKCLSCCYLCHIYS